LATNQMDCFCHKVWLATSMATTKFWLGKLWPATKQALVLRWETWRRELSDVVEGEPPWSEKRGKVFARIDKKKSAPENISWQER
jgi:hypothetical protein